PPLKLGTNTYDQFNSNVLLRPVEYALSISIRMVNEVHTPHSEGFFETGRNHGLFQLTHSGGSEISKMKCGRQSTRESVASRLTF
ncbi:hypothetical protein, partial [Rhodococcus erythropolis]